MITKDQFKQLAKLGQLESQRNDACHSLAFIVEEVGELAKDLVEGDLGHARQESLDVAIAAIGTFYALGGTDKYMEKHVGKQVRKWLRNLKRK